MLERACLIACILTATSPAFGGVWYVEIENDSGTETGASWATAFRTIQKGIDAAFDDGGGEVWVAEGTYSELREAWLHTPVVNTGSLVLKAGVEVYGGFVGLSALKQGLETERSQRNWDHNVTTIDGSVARAGSPAFHVVVGANGAVLDGCGITGGNANGEGSVDERDGAGMYNLAASPTVANCRFTGNLASVDGAGMFNKDNAAPVVTNCTFSMNSATKVGGGMTCWASSPTLTDCDFLANTAGLAGGGIHNSRGSTPTITRGRFIDNESESGAGVYNLESTPTLADCVFEGNLASGWGGGIFNWTASVIVDACAFTGNGADVGGGGIYNQLSSPEITDCEFSDNIAGSGGAVFNSTSSPTISGCTFENNTAQGNPGTAPEGNGGAIASAHTSSPTIVNCLFFDNTADWGGAMHNSTSTVLVTNSTLVDNVAQMGGGAMRDFENVSSSLVNCLLWGNSPDQLSDNGAGQVAVTYSLVQNGHAGEGNTSDAPVFLDSDADDFGLEPDSNGVDMGTASGAPDTDIAGTARPQGAGVDMGAYESTSVPSTGADVNGSGGVDALDVQLVINEALGIITGYDCDINGDGSVNALDVQLVINAALGL